MANEVRWWSASKRAYKNLADMHDRELLNSFKKLQRGEYMGENGDGIEAFENVALTLAFEEQFALRGMDPNTESGYIEPPVADEGGRP